jgi:RNA polymerase sigma-70 factor (ECF subfamily)
MLSDPSPTTPSDSGLTALSMLDRVRRDDADAWRRMVNLYSPLIYSWCLKAGVANEDAADLLQEVWGSVSTHIGRFERTADYGTFRGWLWTITRNKLLDFQRKRAKAAVAVGGSAAQQHLVEVPDREPDDSADSSSGGLMHRALALIRADFEPRTWSAFWRTAVEGATAAEVSSELNLSIDAVYQAKSRVLRRLREELQGLVD